MDKINETEQWKLQGDCSKCRRKEYCRKQCSAAKKEVENTIKRAIYDSKIGRRIRMLGGL